MERYDNFCEGEECDAYYNCDATNLCVKSGATCKINF